MNGELEREILQGRVFEDANRAEQAVDRATEIVASLRNKDVIIRAGWWGPLGVAVIVTAARLGLGAGPFGVAIWATGAFLLNAAVYLARRRQLSRAEASLDGNRARANRGESNGARPSRLSFAFSENLCRVPSTASGPYGRCPLLGAVFAGLLGAVPVVVLGGLDCAQERHDRAHEEC